MKRIITVLLLVTALCFCLVSCGSSDLQLLAGNTSLKYDFTDGEATLKSVPNKSTITEIQIPDEYEGLPVTKIDKFAAVNLEYVTKVTIGKNVREVSDWAFGNSKKITAFEVADENPYICDVDGVLYTKDMKTLLFYPPARAVEAKKDADGNEVKAISYKIPEGVELIRSKAFYKCTDLTEITLPSTLRSIEEKAFFRCSLTSLTLPDGLEFIGKDAFAFNAAVESLTIPASVKQIDEYAFYSCTSMFEVKMLGKQDDMVLGKKWYPTKNGDELKNPELTISWQAN